MQTALFKIIFSLGWVCVLVCLNGCGDDLLNSDLLSSVTSTTPQTDDPASPTPGTPATPSDPLSPDKPTADVGHTGTSTDTPQDPLKETHSIRSEDAGHRSDEFKTTPPADDPRPPHEILDETLRKAMEQSGMKLSAQDIEKVMDILLIRIKNDPAVRDVLRKLLQDPGSTRLQQKLLDLFLEADDEEVRAFLHTAFQNIEYFYEHYYPVLQEAFQDAQVLAPQIKELLSQSKDLYPKIKQTVRTGVEYVRWGIRLSAYTGAAMSIFLGNELFLGVCRAKPKTRFRDDPLQFGREAARHYVLWWFAGLALESYAVINAVHHLELVDSVKGYLGTGALMGALILAQCEGVRALRNRRTSPPACGGHP